MYGMLTVRTSNISCLVSSSPFLDVRQTTPVSDSQLNQGFTFACKAVK